MHQIANPPSESHRQDAKTLSYFRRILGFVWPHKRYLIGSMLCALLVAVTYSASIGSMVPLLKVIVEDEGVHGWVFRTIAQKRLGVELGAYNSLSGERLEGIAEHTAIVRRVKPRSLLGPVPLGTAITRIGPDRVDALTLCERIARAPDGAELDLTIVEFRRGRPFERPVHVRLGRLEHRWRLIRAGVGVLPAGHDAAAKLRTLIGILLGLLVVQVVGNAARFSAEYLLNVVACRAIIDMRRRMYSQVMRMPMVHFTRNVSDTMSRFVQDTQDVFRGIRVLFGKTVREPLKAIGVLGLAFWLDWRLTVVMVVLAPVAIIIIRKMGRKIRRANRRLLQGYAKMLGALESTLTGMRVVKGYTMEGYERRRLFQIDRHMLKQQLRMARIDALMSPLMEMLGFGAASIGVIWLAWRVLEQDLSSAGFAAMVIMLGAMFDPLRKLSTVYTRFQRANAAAERIFQLIDAPSEPRLDGRAPVLKRLRESIEFRDVSFTYPQSAQPAVRNVSLTVPRGQIVALVGPNGSGKTTLVSLLPRFFDPQQGRILIDGQDIRQVSLRSLRSQISLVTQDAVIFPDTVRANIAYGRPGASNGEVVAAAQKAFADEFIRQLPDGYETVIGEHGATLSGGEKQRIAIARAILRDAPIFIFDEATSQIDSESERKIQQALRTFLQGRTAFVIAHRFSTLRQAHRLVVMDEGTIVATGTHESLLQSCPLYARLYEDRLRDG